MQLCLGWWLYQSGHISRRGFRIFLAAFEMRERRRYAELDDERRPLYRLAELQKLIGAATTATAAAELRAEVTKLQRIGLVTIEEHDIVFATSVDQIALDDATGFWELFEQIPNRRRPIPVPRRTLRAMAGGELSKAVLAVMCALLIRSLHWHVEQNDFRVDGRTKLSYISETFGISRRAVTDAWSELIAMGWLEPLACSQVELNRWGRRAQINVDWDPRAEKSDQASSVGEGGRASGGSDPDNRRASSAGESASPAAQNPGRSASPYINQTLLLKKNLKTTRNPIRGQRPRPDRSGVSDRNQPVGRRQGGSKSAEPNLHDVQGRDLEDNQRLLGLYRQAIGLGLATDSEAGQVTFFCLAQRACDCGERPGALFAWLLREHKIDFITQANEEAALRRLRELRDGPCVREEQPGVHAVRQSARYEFSADEKFIAACLRVAQQRRLEPYLVAGQVKDWSRAEWEQRLSEFERAQRRRWGGCDAEFSASEDAAS